MLREIRDAERELVLQIGQTTDFAANDLGRAQRLLEGIFERDFSVEDWEHALGGMQILAWAGDVLVGHAALVPRLLTSETRSLRTGYVEAVGVAASHQCRGIGGKLMSLLEAEIVLHFELGALSASDVGAAFYRKRGWVAWQGPLLASTPSGVARTADEDGGVFVWPPSLSLDQTLPLCADFRSGDIW
jgi:aminoglycoside 2'-N-acetyltransferase I